MQRALKPGGLLLLEGYRPEQIGYGTGRPSAVENLYTEPMLREAFGGMQLLELPNTGTCAGIIEREPRAAPSATAAHRHRRRS